MRASACIGRVGGLAVALGVGAVIATGGAGLAWGAPADDSVSADATAGAGTPRTRHTPPRTAHVSAGVPAGRREIAERTAARPVSAARAAGARSPAAAAAGVGRMDSVSANSTAAPTVTGSAVASAAVVDPVSDFLFNQTPTLSPVRIGQGPTGVVRGSLNGLDADSAPLSYTVVSAPAHGSVSIDSAGDYTYTPDQSLVHDGYTDSFQVTVSDAGTGFHIHGLLGLINLLSFGLIGASGHTATSTVSVTVSSVNSAPTATLAAGPPDPATGVVAGQVTAGDADADPLTFSAAGMTKGAVAFGSAGSFTYTPTATARHNAASLSATDADRADTFTITVSDGHTGTAVLPVTVDIVSFNTAPTVSPAVGTPDPSTGAVLGTLNPVDAEGDSLAYAAAGAARGTVQFGPAGGFTYTPTDSARHDAAALSAGAAELADGFTVTVSDGHGGAVAVPIVVTIAPANATPVASSSSGNPDASTGVVLGAVAATDADGDPLSFSGTAPTAKGAVVVNPDGSFTYTPTASARHDAAALGATGGDRADSFTVTVTDAHGGAAAVPVTVAILPANAAPAVASAAVGSPDADSGVVAGAVLGADADNDPLTYTAAGAAKGSVAFGAAGSFTYTPTATARHNAAWLGATAGDRADSFTVTVDDGHGGTAAAPLSVSIAPANAAPTGSATAGAPDAVSGLVAGAVLGADADTDPLTYTASGAAKGTVTVAADGTFTYTPTAIARHSAFLASATADDLTDAFTVTVSDGYGGSVGVPVTVTIAPAGVSFSFSYGSGANYWSNPARAALQSAAANLATYVVATAPVTLTYDVTGQSNPGSTLLATASATFTGGSAGYFGTVAQTKILTGFDYNGAAADSTIAWNFGQPWDYDNSINNRAYDFQAVALHELLHSLGFLTGIGDPSVSIDRSWSTYDSFLSASDGTKVIDAGYMWLPAYTGNLTGSGGGLFFTGPTVVAVYGGPVPLHTPGTWSPGSSVSHLDPSTPTASTHVMNPSESFGAGVRVISPVELAILTDLGYTVTPTPVVAFTFIALGFIRRRKP